MDYLLSWSEGEEVFYRLINFAQLKNLKIEADKIYTLTELRTGREIRNINSFLKNVA